MISSDLTALTGNAEQADVTIAIGIINDTIDELGAPAASPILTAESSITLVASTREYALASDFAGFAESALPVMVDQTNGSWLYEYPGGYDAMFRDQTIPANYTGLPTYWAINPSNRKIRLNTIPSSVEAGRVYTYKYRLRTNLTAATDTFPYTDEVTAQLLAAACWMFKKEIGRDWDAMAYKMAMSRAARLLGGPPAERYFYG